MSTTMEDLIGQVLRRLSMYGGIDTQTYAQDRILDIIQEKFDMLFDRLWWPAYTVEGEAMTLDGTLGVVTADLTSKIKRYEDLRYVFYEKDEHPLPGRPSNVNPNEIRLRCIGPTATNKIFRVYPATLTGTVRVTYRTKPDTFGLDSEILLDATLLKLYACADYLEDDGTNPTAVEKFNNLANERLSQFETMLQQQSISMHRYTASVQTEWH